MNKEKKSTQHKMNGRTCELIFVHNQTIFLREKTNKMIGKAKQLKKKNNKIVE